MMNVEFAKNTLISEYSSEFRLQKSRKRYFDVIFAVLQRGYVIQLLFQRLPVHQP